MIDRCINDHESLDQRIPALFATAHFYHHVLLITEFAQLTNRKADQQQYESLAQKSKRHSSKSLFKLVQERLVTEHLQNRPSVYTTDLFLKR